MTLAMLAYTFLVVATVTKHARHLPPLGLIPLTCNDIQHLFAAVAYRPTGDDGRRGRGLLSAPPQRPAAATGWFPMQGTGQRAAVG